VSKQQLMAVIFVLMVVLVVLVVLSSFNLGVAVARYYWGAQ